MIAQNGNANIDPSLDPVIAAGVHHDTAELLREQRDAGADPDVMVDDIGYPAMDDVERVDSADVMYAQRAEAAEASGRVLTEHEAPGTYAKISLVPNHDEYDDQADQISPGHARMRMDRKLRPNDSVQRRLRPV